MWKIKNKNIYGFGEFPEKLTEIFENYTAKLAEYEDPSYVAILVRESFRRGIPLDFLKVIKKYSETGVLSKPLTFVFVDLTENSKVVKFRLQMESRTDEIQWEKYYKKYKGVLLSKENFIKKGFQKSDGFYFDWYATMLYHSFNHDLIYELSLCGR